MRLVTFEHEGKGQIGGVVGDQVVPLVIAAARNIRGFDSMLVFLQGGADSLRLAARLLSPAGQESHHALSGFNLSSVRLLPPVPSPSKIVAIGMNYRDHALEQGIEPPKEPLIFAKFPSSITGPYDPIVIPREDPQVDYEAELAVIIGKTAHRVSPDEALDYVAGYTVLNDVSARAWQFSDQQWTRGKSCDSFAPMGPWITTKEDLPDPHSLAIVTRVNGETLQQSNTRNLIFQIPALIEYISSSITLNPGDVIATGTPPGVGVFRKPPRFLQPGDIVEVEIEGLGSLRNEVRPESPGR